MVIKIEVVKNGPKAQIIVWAIGSGPKVEIISAPEQNLPGVYHFNSHIVATKDISLKEFESILAGKK